MTPGNKEIVPIVASLPFRLGSDLKSAALDYSQTVRNEPGLLAYWRVGETQDGGAGRESSYVALGVVPHLDEDPGGDASVEFFFQIISDEQLDYEPCLISHQIAHGEQTRFAFHVTRDLTALRFLNGTTNTLIFPPDGPIKVGQWYHFLATSKPRQEFRAYIDGVECFLDMGSLAFGVRPQACPIQIGASSAGGEDRAVNCAIDEVAIYNVALTPLDVARHVDASGRETLRKQMVHDRRQRESKENEVAVAALRARLNDPALFDPGETKVYDGQYLDAISLPVGGIGAGLIQVNGKAERSIWQIFNNFEHIEVPNSFFAAWARPRGKEPVVRALQTSDVGVFPAMDRLRFRGEYPFGWFEFADAAFPLRVEMEVFNPLIPLNVKSSSIPCGIFNLTASNGGDSPVEVSFLATQQNAIGIAGDDLHKGYGGNVNRVIREEDATSIHMTQVSSPDEDMVLSAQVGNACATASWTGLRDLYEAFSRDGDLEYVEPAGSSATDKTVDCALATPFVLQPGEKRTITFVLTWYFPNTNHGTRIWMKHGNMYSNWWAGALDVYAYLKANIDDLTQQTRRFHDTLYASNLPHWLLDRISSQVAVLRSKTCFWAKDGYFGANEGCAPTSGCCLGNCSHVWHYAQAQARLFPEVARRMREQTFALQREDGGVPFRHSARHFETQGPAIDGMLGDILSTYREYMCSSDQQWLHAHWPSVQKAMDFVIARWDSDEDGLLSGSQHNTLDGELSGSTSWMGTLYLSALAASEKMAELENDAQSADRYRRLREKGTRNQNQTLWNGEYYVQSPDEDAHEDYGDGCHIDQVLGEWWAPQANLPGHYPQSNIRSALRSLLQYNFKHHFRTTTQRPRKFVDNDDAAMKMISWPKGPQPFRSMKYGDEAMTGFEYGAAATMVQFGMLKEGLMVARAVYDRYDGRLRDQLTEMNTASWGYSGNPFGDDECGKFYARAMSVWSLLLACQGFVYEGPKARIGFAPVWNPDDHVSFFTAAEGWGLFGQRRDVEMQVMELSVEWGRLPVRIFEFELSEGRRVQSVVASGGGEVISTTVSFSDDIVSLTLKEEVVLTAGDKMTVEVLFNQ